jgi:hypothetical protein
VASEPVGEVRIALPLVLIVSIDMVSRPLEMSSSMSPLLHPVQFEMDTDRPNALSGVPVLVLVSGTVPKTVPVPVPDSGVDVDTDDPAPHAAGATVPRNPTRTAIRGKWIMQKLNSGRNSSHQLRLTQ